VDRVNARTKVRIRTGSGLVTRFLLIVFLSIGIDAGLDIYQGLAKRNALPAELRAEAIAQTRAAALDLERTFDGAQQLLGSLAKLPDIRDLDVGACNALKSIGRALPMYDYISVRRTDGRLECGSLAPVITIPADSWLGNRVPAPDGLAIGTYGRGKITGNEVIRLLYPINASDGSVIGSISAGLSLIWLNSKLEEWHLPDGAVAEVADLNGIRLAGSPDHQHIGYPIPSALWPALGSQNLDVIDAPGAHSTVRVYGHTTVRPGSIGGVFVAVGLDRAAAAAAVARSTWHDLQGSLIVLAAVVFLSWLALSRTIKRPIQNLLATAARWREGDWTARPSVHTSVAEFRALATGFHAMADAVAARDLELRRSQEHLAQAQRVAATGSFELDFRTNGLVWSEETYRIHGLDPRAGPPTLDAIDGLLLPDDREAIQKAHAEVRAGLVDTLKEYRIRRPDGAIRTVYREVEPMLDGAGQRIGIIGVVKDVTELREAERQRDDLQQQLLHAQKMEAIGTLAGGIAHDLNNALLPVVALSTLTMKRLAREDRAYQNLVLIHDAGIRARDLVRRILDFARKSDSTWRRVDLAVFVGTALSLLRSTLPATIAIEDRLEPVPPIWADETQIHQILMNLVTNAAHAIGTAMGTVTVEVAATASGSVRLSVADSGCGMDAATRQRIFEPFYTTKDVGVGTGLGLSVVHGIVTAHRGTISVESTPGDGTRFDLEFPIAEAEQEESQVA